MKWNNDPLSSINNHISNIILMRLPLRIGIIIVIVLRGITLHGWLGQSNTQI